ncbi:cytochrome b [Sphingomonas sp. KR1UV-12]|uniref:Cytochrome b n=1 Tax=Sphingomonas aurea TaxID=3063994 RepID=A0ABT9EM77_9SPHN|nr:cytochrome b [Sphingomonas sp. KR1UV-12]MDP1028065.1 cytochrome b [Sphingomonas sp. KR1UV-12]
MTTRPEQTARYSTVAMWFHWTIAVLVIANLTIGIFHDAIGFMSAHKAIGLTVLALTAGRVAWRITHRPPPLPARTPGWERGLAHATHWTLYLLMIAMPVTGWLMVSGTATRRPLTWFGLFDLPYLPVGEAAGGFGHDAHGLLGWLMLALVVLHIAAALRHRLILRDGILGRMAPALDR